MRISWEGRGGKLFVQQALEIPNKSRDFSTVVYESVLESFSLPFGAIGIAVFGFLPISREERFLATQRGHGNVHDPFEIL